MALPFVLVAVIGCSNRTSTFEIVDYRDGGEVRRYRETFDEAYYHLDKHGNLEIVLRRTTPSQPNPGRMITQIIHIRSVWRCIPGNTIAHSTQINGTVSYHIVTGEVGATFEGAGSVFFTQNRKKSTLRGSLDLATLKPTRQLGAAHDLFRRAELRGRFQAKRDPRCVTRIVNEMDRLFGSVPAHRSTRVR